MHTGLFLYAESESELASVLAHEITHVTQRHIARYMEAQASSSAMTLAGLVGSIALAVINPTAGIAALQTTLGLSMQSAINYTRDNEYEADRIGMKRRCMTPGSIPWAWPTSSRSWRRSTRYASKPPEMLLTHPCPETPDQRSPCPGRELWRARPAAEPGPGWPVRIQVRYGTETPQALLTYFDSRLQKGITPQDAAIYGRRWPCCSSSAPTRPTP